jgi:S1-C subfamily serine protease
VSVFKSVSPAVAFIQTSTLAPQSPFSLRPMEYPSGSGSGFLWDEDGHVVTNWHVIAGGGGRSGGGGAMPRRVKVSLQGLDKPVDAEVVGFEEDKCAARPDTTKQATTNAPPRPTARR